jgi:coatomer subunit beta'
MQDLCQKARAAKKLNVSFLAAFMLQDVDMCLDLLVSCGRLPEAAFFARTYRPSRCFEMLQLWIGDLNKVNARAAATLADPSAYPHLFPEWQIALEAEQQQYAGDMVQHSPIVESEHAATGFDVVNKVPLLPQPHR